ncbi:MAG: threonine/serine exporter family protein [Clostridia bacterium]|nr:threonine/serine exporter family protein [Clostridia bacterium]
MNYLTQFIFAYISTAGFAVIFNAPSRAIYKSGLAGALGWLCYMLALDAQLDKAIASFIGALIVGLISEWYAIKTKRPVTIYVIPGIIPLVPGFGLYYTILSIIQNDYPKAAQTGFEATFIAIGIALGLILALQAGKGLRTSYIHRQHLSR